MSTEEYIQRLIDTRLFESSKMVIMSNGDIFYGWWRLKETMFQFYIGSNAPGECPTGEWWPRAPFEEILEEVPEEIAEKLIFNIDLFI